MARALNATAGVSHASTGQGMLLQSEKAHLLSLERYVFISLEKCIYLFARLLLSYHPILATWSICLNVLPGRACGRKMSSCGIFHTPPSAGTLPSSLAGSRQCRRADILFLTLPGTRETRMPLLEGCDPALLR